MRWEPSTWPLEWASRGRSGSKDTNREPGTTLLSPLCPTAAPRHHVALPALCPPTGAQPAPSRPAQSLPLQPVPLSGWRKLHLAQTGTTPCDPHGALFYLWAPDSPAPPSLASLGHPLSHTFPRGEDSRGAHNACRKAPCCARIEGTQQVLQKGSQC